MSFEDGDGVVTSAGRVELDDFDVQETYETEVDHFDMFCTCARDIIRVASVPEGASPEVGDPMRVAAGELYLAYEMGLESVPGPGESAGRSAFEFYAAPQIPGRR